MTQPSEVTQGIVATKAHLAKQGLTIPCLDLVAAHMAANVVTNVREDPGGTPIEQVYFWSDPSAWPMDVTTTATAETLSKAKVIREIFKLAEDRDTDEFEALLNKHSLWKTLRISAWITRLACNARSLPQERM